jgi:signal transduction histidine kinase
VALQRLVDDTAARAGLRGCFHSQAGLEPLPQPVATCLYRLAQEALNNVAKHAQATSFEVKLAQDENAVTLTIMDNGMGFDASTPRAGRSTLGLVSMKERVHLVQGMLEIHSTIGRGTSVCARVPLLQVAS